MRLAPRPAHLAFIHRAERGVFGAVTDDVSVDGAMHWSGNSGCDTVIDSAAQLSSTEPAQAGEGAARGGSRRN